MPRLLSIGHSYVVALNRRLAHEMARAGAGRWEVTVVAPQFMYGDLRSIDLEPFPGEACHLEPVRAYLTRWPHVMGYGWKLKSVLRAGWDVVHCWEEPYVFCGAQIARWAGRKQLVPYTFQNLPKQYPPPFNWLERYTMRRATGWLAAGHTVQDTLLARPEYTGKPNRVITLGVDTEVFRPDPEAGATVRRELGWEANGPPVVGYLGRFIPEKGIRLLLRALEAARSPWRALFVGGGPLEAELRTWAEKFPDRIRVVTGVSHDRVPPYLNAMSLLAAPSQTGIRWREQLGRMLIEAFACGVPVIGSDSGEIPFVVGGAGRILPEAADSAWAATLEELLDSPAIRANLSALGRDRAEAEFSWPVIARQHLEFFEHGLDRPC